MGAATPITGRRCNGCDRDLPPTRFPQLDSGERSGTCAACVESVGRGVCDELELFAEMLRQPWRAQAHCRTLDPELFYPDKGDASAPQRMTRICGDCPVQPECAEWGVAYERHGWWGGVSERTVSQIRTARAAGEDLPTPLPGERIDDIRARADPCARAA